jgi:hypothetical protein
MALPCARERPVAAGMKGTWAATRPCARVQLRAGCVAAAGGGRGGAGARVVLPGRGQSDHFGWRAGRAGRWKGVDREGRAELLVGARRRVHTRQHDRSAVGAVKPPLSWSCGWLQVLYFQGQLFDDVAARRRGEADSVPDASPSGGSCAHMRLLTLAGVTALAWPKPKLKFSNLRCAGHVASLGGAPHTKGGGTAKRGAM